MTPELQHGGANCWLACTSHVQLELLHTAALFISDPRICSVFSWHMACINPDSGDVKSGMVEMSGLIVVSFIAGHLVSRVTWVLVDLSLVTRIYLFCVFVHVTKPPSNLISWKSLFRRAPGLEQQAVLQVSLEWRGHSWAWACVKLQGLVRPLPSSLVLYLLPDVEGPHVVVQLCFNQDVQKQPVTFGCLSWDTWMGLMFRNWWPET